MIAFRLPFPPSVNDMFVNKRAGASGRGRFPSSDYKNWLKAAGLMLNTQQRAVQTFPFERRVCVEIQLNSKRAGDCDNRIKPVLDMLVKQKVLAGDSKRYVRGVGIEWMDDLGDVECMVIIYPEDDIV